MFWNLCARARNRGREPPFLGNSFPTSPTAAVLRGNILFINFSLWTLTLYLFEFHFLITIVNLSPRAAYNWSRPPGIITYGSCGFIYTAGYDSDVILRAEKVKKGDKVYLNFDKMKLDIRIGKAYVYLSNLFGGDPILG